MIAFVTSNAHELLFVYIVYRKNLVSINCSTVGELTVSFEQSQSQRYFTLTGILSPRAVVILNLFRTISLIYIQYTIKFIIGQQIYASTNIKLDAV